MSWNDAGPDVSRAGERREPRGLLWLEDLARDVRYGLRVLKRSPAFTSVAILTLALGIGANAAIFHLIDAVSLRSLPIVDPHGIVDVRAEGTFNIGINTGANGRVTYPLWEEIRTHQRAFAGVFAWAEEMFVVGEGAGAQRVYGLWVSGDFFRTLGIQPVRGRLLSEADDRSGCGDPPVVVSYEFWQRALGGDDQVAGRTITIYGQPVTIAGVTPAGFTGLEVGRTFDLALPLCIPMTVTDVASRRDFWGLRVMGRLAPDWTLAAADEHLSALSPGMLETTVPSGYSAAHLDRYRSLRFGAYPAGRGVSQLRDTHGTSLSLLLGLTGIVLLVTCVNLATLMLARAGAREREVAMRAAMGAPRHRLVSQLVIESMLVAAAGAAAAVPVALVSANALVAFLESPIRPINPPLGLDWPLVAFVTAAAAVTTLLFGLLPALRISMVDPMAAARETSRGLTADRHRARLRRALVAGQIALSLVLVASAVLFVRSFSNLSAVELGFDPERVVVAELSDPGLDLTMEQRLALQQELTVAIRSVPGVAAAAASTHVPLRGDVWSHAFRVLGAGDDERRMSRFAFVTPGYFDTLAIPVLAGRDFEEHDRAGSRLVLVVNESFVRHHLGTEPPLGAYVRTEAELGHPEATYEIVGVVGDTKYARMRNDECLCGTDAEPRPPIAYVPIAQHPNLTAWAAMMVRVDGSVPTVTDAVARRIETLRPGFVQFHELAPRIRATLATERTLAWLAGAFGGLAILLVVVGLYGVIAYLVVSRRAEIGIRLALGSTRAQIVNLVLRDSFVLLALGALIGLPLAVAAMHGAGSLLFGIAPTDIPTLAGATVLLALAGGLAGGIPACRAALLHPMAAIRDEPESLWQTAGGHVRRAVQDLTAREEPAPSAALVARFAGLVQRSASFSEALGVALSALREHTGARRIVFLEKVSAGEYRGGDVTIPARGLLVPRLRHYSHPLSLTAGDIHVWRQWAGERRPEHAGEIAALERSETRMVVALRVQSEIVGLLLLAPAEGRDGFSATERQVLRAAGDVFALLVENARLNARALEQEKIRRDLALAAEVQKRLLPAAPPQCDGAGFAAFTLPARTVGGDYYDFLELADGGVGLAVADVAGKGIAAALLTSAVHTSLRVMMADRDIAPSQLAARMNMFLHQSTDGASYATFFYARLDVSCRRLRYVNAGHNPPYLVRRQDAGVELVQLKAGGTPLGLLPGMPYDEGTLDLHPGDLLVAFTDGVPEARNADGEEFGEDRLEALLRVAAQLPPEDIAAMLTGHLQDWMGGAEQHDDVTLVIAALNGSDVSSRDANRV